jgi:hypothetical protein
MCDSPAVVAGLYEQAAAELEMAAAQHARVAARHLAP